MGVCLLVRSWPSIELRGCTDLFGMITQGRVDLYEFDPITYRYTGTGILQILQGFSVQYLVPLGPSWCLRQVKVLVDVSPSVLNKTQYEV